jgi:PAS domain S-box-containing protein
MQGRIGARLPRQLALAYAAGAILWIAGSDAVLHAIVPDPALLARFSMVKGLLFVGVTTGLLFLLSRRLVHTCDRHAVAIRAAMEKRDAAEAQVRVLRRAVDESPAAIMITDRQGRIEFVNQSFTRTSGYSFAEVQERNPRLLRDGGTAPEVYQDMWRTILAGKVWRGEFCNRRKSGELFWETAVISPVHDPAGTITHFLAIKEDVTEQRAVARARRESEELYRTLVTASPDPIVVLDRDGTVRFVSPCARTVFGYAEAAELTGRDMLLSIGPQDRERALRAFRAVLEKNLLTAGECTLLRADGSAFAAEMKVAPLRADDGPVTAVMIIVRDVSERKQAEARLLASEVRFREVIETIAEVIWIWEAATRSIVYVSPNFERVWGRTREDLYRTTAVWTEAVHPEDREGVRATFGAAFPTEKTDQTFRIVRPDGAVRWIRDQAFAVRDAAGAVVRIVGAAEDVTERKDIERQFFRAQRLEAIGTLASGVAHDMNNILAPMLFVPALLRERLREPADLQLLTMLEQSAQRGAGIVKQLLTFSRGEEGARGPVQVTHLAKEMLHIIRETFPREIAVKWRATPHVAPVHADPTQIHQVLMNLCVNARDAMPQGGTLVLSADMVEFDDARAAQLHAPAGGSYVRISVHDSGHGIPPENCERIFDPFFTTKEPGKGTGLGLSTVLGIVKAHGGFVLVHSQVGAGSTFEVHLPAAPGAVVPEAGPAPETRARGAGELVLVVDDEAVVRETTKQVLEFNGYRVATAANGAEALERLSPEVRLVLTDMMMPTMNGLVLVRQLRARVPELPVIAATGLGSDVYAAPLESLGVTRLLHKPYAAADLLAAVGAMLARPR